MIIITHELLELITDNNAFIVLVKSIAKRANYHDNSCFPSITTMEKDTGMSRHTVIDACKWLKEKGIIRVEQRKNDNGGNTSNFYVIETDLVKIIGKLKIETPVQNLHYPSAENAHPPVQNLHSNHKYNITTSTNNLKKENKFDANKYINFLGEENKIETEILDLLLAWLEIRKMKKTPTSQKAIDLALQKLSKYNITTQKQMIENSILNGWTGLFEIKENKKPPEPSINRPDLHYETEVIYV